MITFLYFVSTLCIVLVIWALVGALALNGCSFLLHNWPCEKGFESVTGEENMEYKQTIGFAVFSFVLGPSMIILFLFLALAWVIIFSARHLRAKF